MTTFTSAATANVLGSLPRAAATACLEAVLATHPDIVALQEWGIGRHDLLSRPGWVWVHARYAGIAIGVRSDRYDVLGRRLHALAGVALIERRVRPVPVLPPRLALAVTVADRLSGHRVTVVGYHLVPGAQRRGSYREDRPRLAARHRAETVRLAEVVGSYTARGHTVLAMGDSNFDGFELPGLTSAWAELRDDHRGTLGSSRKIDDVFGPAWPQRVELVRTASDHAAVVVRRADPVTGVG